MTYGPALEKAWTALSGLTGEKRLSVRFLADEYEIDPIKRTILSVSCNVPTKDYLTIILLHYLIKTLGPEGLPAPAGKWIDFRELEGGQGYYPAFKKRTIDVVLHKYGSSPDALLNINERFSARKVQAGDVGVVIEPFKNVLILITLNRADEEFGPDANILLDETAARTFCTEDIVVLTEIVVHAL